MAYLFLLYLIAKEAGFFSNVFQDSKGSLVREIPFRDLRRTLKTHSWKRYKKRSLSKITTIVIHHSAGPINQTAADFARYHVNHHDWPGIGYHFVIDTNGTVNQVNSLETVSYHVCQNNTRSIGICLVGNFNLHQPTRAQLDNLVLLIRSLKKNIPGIQIVNPHRHYGAWNPKTNSCGHTDCPGERFPIERVLRSV